jgi:hypothetical protein
MFFALTYTLFQKGAKSFFIKNVCPTKCSAVLAGQVFKISKPYQLRTTHSFLYTTSMSKYPAGTNVQVSRYAAVLILHEIPHTG